MPKNSVFDLPSIRAAKAWELFDNGHKTIHDLNPAEFKGVTKRAIEVTQSGVPFVDKTAIARELNRWQWPLYFFDFETIVPAIPRYKSARPYMAIPFQFSCHVWDDPASSTLEHFEYLHQETSDPRDGIVSAMLNGLGKNGSIVAYNQRFETGVIKALANRDKTNRKRLLSLISRFVDPLPIFRACVYHPEFLGSFSIKYVAPALVGGKLSYAGLKIADGSSAQAAAEQILRGRVSGKELAALVNHLLTYCRQDTMAMVEIVKWLMNVSK